MLNEAELLDALKRPICTQSNGRGSQKRYFFGIEDYHLEYDENDKEYPWFFSHIENGRIASSANTFCFHTQRDALQAFCDMLDGGESVC